MNTTVPDIPTYFGQTRGTKADFRNRPMNRSPVEYRVSYINNLCVPVVIASRSGMKFTIPSEHSMTCDKFIVRVDIILSRSAKMDAQRLLSVVKDNITEEMKAMRESFTLQMDNTHGGATITLEYLLSLKMLKEYGGTVYYNELDTVISLNDLEDVLPHPFSEEGRLANIALLEKESDTQPHFQYNIEVIDNLGKYGNRYINIGRDIYKIVAKKDKLKRDGVYIVSNVAAVTGERDIDGITSRHFAFDKVEDLLGLYGSYEDAKNLGDVGTARKNEVLNLEHQVNRQKQEFLLTKNMYDTSLMEKEKEIKLLTIEREESAKALAEERARVEHEREMESRRLKDYYESKSFIRKDDSETLKFIPSLIVGLGAVFMAIRTFTA